MNVSFSYLTLSLITNSPILSYPISSHYSYKVVNHIQISHLFSTFYYKSTLFHSNAIKKSTHSFLNSKFENLLNRAIEIDSKNVLSYQVPIGRIIFSLDFTHIDNCIFKHISNPTNFGGALMTFSGLEIQNSLFLRCLAQEGGALSCHEDLSMTHVTFQDCEANSESGAFDRRAGNVKYQCDIKLCTLSKCKAEYFGAFYTFNQRGSFNMKYDNFSQITAKQCVGCFEVSTSLTHFEFIIISESVARVHNGCSVVRDSKSIKFDYCLFYKCSHSSFVSDAGAVLLCYDNPQDSIISNSLFLFNKPSDSYTIAVSGGYGKLRIIKSFFTGDEKKEINQNGNINVDQETVKFNYNCENDIFDNIDLDKTENDENINQWKNKFKTSLSDNSFGCLTTNFNDHESDGNDDDKGNFEDIDIKELINADTNNPQDFFIIHLIAIFIALLVTFILLHFTNFVIKLVQSHKNSRENE